MRNSLPRAFLALPLAGLPLSALAQAPACEAEIADFAARFEALDQDDPAVAAFRPQLDAARAACAEGNATMVDVYAQALEAFLDSMTPDTGMEAEAVAELPAPTGTWCYTHESGETGEYVFDEDGSYALHLSQHRWQQVATGRTAELFEGARVVHADDDAIQVDLGAFGALYERGACPR